MGYAHDSAARSQASLQAVFVGVFWAHVRLKANTHTLTHTHTHALTLRRPFCTNPGAARGSRLPQSDEPPRAAPREPWSGRADPGVFREGGQSASAPPGGHPRGVPSLSADRKAAESGPRRLHQRRAHARPVQAEPNPPAPRGGVPGGLRAEPPPRRCARPCSCLPPHLFPGFEVGMLPPTLRQLLQFAIHPVGQDNLETDILVAGLATRADDTLALQSQAAPRRGSLGDRHGHRARDRRHIDFRAEHGLVERYRELHLDVVPVTREDRMRKDTNRDERVAGRPFSEAGSSLAPKPQRLAVVDTRRNGDLDSLAVRHRHAALRPADGIQKVDLQMVTEIRAARMERFPVVVAAAARSSSKKVREEVGCIFVLLRPHPGIVPPTGILSRILVVVVPLGPFLPAGVNLARVEAFPLFGIAKEPIGGGHRLKLGLLAGIIGVQVRVKRLRELAVRLLDLVLARRLRHTEDLVRIVAQEVSSPIWNKLCRMRGLRALTKVNRWIARDHAREMLHTRCGSPTSSGMQKSPPSRRADRASLTATPGASRAIPASTTALAQSLCRAWIRPSDPARKRAQFKEIRRFPRRVGKEAGKNWSYQLRSLGDAIRCQKEFGRDEGGQTRAGVGFRCLACRNSQRQSRSGYAPE